MRLSFFNKIYQATRNRNDFVLLNPNMNWSNLAKFEQAGQLVDVGIAEINMIALATGLSDIQFQVMTYSAGHFSTLRTAEFLRNLPNARQSNLKIIVGGAGFGSVPVWGVSHFATEDLGTLTSFKRTEIFSPADIFEAEAIAELILQSDQFQIVRINAADPSPVHAAPLNPRQIAQLQRGEPLLVQRPVIDLTTKKINTAQKNSSAWQTESDLPSTALFATGTIISQALAAVPLLANTTKLSIYSCPKYPLDSAAVLKIAGTVDLVVTLEEHVLNGGLGTLIAQILATAPRPQAPSTPTNPPSKPTLRLAYPQLIALTIDDPFNFLVGDLDYLRQQSGLTTPQIAQTISSHFTSAPTDDNANHRGKANTRE